MKKHVILSLLSILTLCISHGQSKRQQDREAIKKMCGCYEVTFNFAETFSYSKDSLYRPSKNKNDKALEWVQLVADEKDKISMQHLLQVGNPSKPHIVKHWRQDWVYQNTDFYTYNKNNSWTYSQKKPAEVKGQWSQKVYQVDDSPRYEGSATWVHVDGKSFWENTADAPLPRREYTKRSDYNVTIRRNRHEITNNGWIHDQDNDKVIRENRKEDLVLAKEKGFNTYNKVDDSKCSAAAEWWKKNTTKWSTVRAEWQTIFNKKTDLNLHEKVENKPLYKYLFDDENYSSASQIQKIISEFTQTTIPE